VIGLQRAADGHFHWPGRVNGSAVDFLVDTGATSTTLPAALAHSADLPHLSDPRLGIDVPGRLQFSQGNSVRHMHKRRRGGRLPTAGSPGTRPAVGARGEIRQACAAALVTAL
jgi:hypothetical protein